MNRSVLALAPERRSGWAAVIADGGGLVTATVPAMPGTAVPVLDSVLPLVTPMAGAGEVVEVAIELLPDEAFCDEVVTAVTWKLGAAGIRRC